MKTHQKIVDDVRALGYECSIIEGRPYLRYDFFSTDMKESQDNYYFIVDDLEAEGLEFDEPYIEHDCITGFVQESIELVMTLQIYALLEL